MNKVFLILAIFLFSTTSCINYYHYPKYNKDSSTFEIVVGDDIVFSDNNKTDSCKLIFQFFSLSNGSISKITKKNTALIFLEIDKQNFKLDSMGIVNCNLKAGIKTVSVTDKSNLRQPLKKNRIKFSNNSVNTINIYLLLDYHFWKNNNK